MTGYELRAQHEPADPVGRDTTRWHVVRQGAFVAMCGYRIDPVADTRPIGDVEEIAPECRCPECWEWWGAVEQVWAEGSPREPEP
ncbi:hypothetical protein [Streptacidiphilus sp. MAP5-3]|uniref:hypothetical protein n=1 Tax=unclassified Streptacidiphilus TaxID=2643834 RepID=UPI003515387A